MEKFKITSGSSAVNFTDGIARVQHLAGINVTGKLDDETKKLFIIPRCGVFEEEDSPQQPSDVDRFYLQGVTYWKKKVSIAMLNFVTE